MIWPEAVTMKEVGPRDGLQNEKGFVATEDKITWINLLSQTGLSYIEITSFVSPKWIPALADAREVAKQITRHPDVTYAALVPNMQGLEMALEVGVDEVAVFMSASEMHNKKNINKSLHDTFPLIHEVVKDAFAAKKTVRGYISTVFGCPYEGAVPVETVIIVAEKLFAMGITEISLGDTIGVAHPHQVQLVLAEMLKRFPKEKLAMHFHDTRGMALANVIVALQMGITTFDGSVGGLGGCPYAPGAAGNVATDDLSFMLEKMGIETNINREKLLRAATFIEEKIGRPLSSHRLQMIRQQI